MMGHIRVYLIMLHMLALKVFEVHDVFELTSPYVTTPSMISHEVMHLFFAWMLVDRICKSFECITQFMQMLLSKYLQKRYCSANPAANIFCQAEADATNIIFSNTLAVDGGQTVA